MNTMKLVSWLGFLASTLGLFVSLAPSPSEITWWQVTLATLSLTAFAYFMFDDLHPRSKRFKSREDIVKYMNEWISKGTCVTIFTNDMTWANNPETTALLYTKAERGELTICMPKPTSMSDECRKRGATVITYERLNLIPRSRFTIINERRMDAQLAVGRSADGVHTVHEYGIGSDAVFAVANDLVDVIRSLSTQDLKSKD